MKYAIFFLFISLNQPCLGKGTPYPVTHRNVLFYVINVAYFDTNPPVIFTVKDFIRTNKMLETKVYALAHISYQKDEFLSALVAPQFSNDQYRIIIYSDRSLDSLQVHEIARFVEAIMCKNSGAGAARENGDRHMK